jgi:hypothetical protein
MLAVPNSVSMRSAKDRNAGDDEAVWWP